MTAACRWMEAVHQQVSYGLGQALKPYSLNIPVINFSHVNDTDDKKLLEYNNNSKPCLYKQEFDSSESVSTDDQEQSLTAKEVSDDHKELCLSLRLKQLKRHINWIHHEMVCATVPEYRSTTVPQSHSTTVS